MPMYRVYLICSYSLHVINSRQKKPYCNIMYKLCNPTGNCTVVLLQSISAPTIHITWFYCRLFQRPLSTQLSQRSVLLQKFPGSEQSTQGHYTPRSGMDGRYSIRRQARNFGSLNHITLYCRSLQCHSESHRLLASMKCH